MYVYIHYMSIYTFFFESILATAFILYQKLDYIFRSIFSSIVTILNIVFYMYM